MNEFVRDSRKSKNRNVYGVSETATGLLVSLNFVGAHTVYVREKKHSWVNDFRYSDISKLNISNSIKIL